MDAFVHYAGRAGIDILHLRCPNDVRNMQRITAAKMRAHVQAVSYTISPVHDIPYYVIGPHPTAYGRIRSASRIWPAFSPLRRLSWSAA